eukprot:s1269_g16.t1
MHRTAPGCKTRAAGGVGHRASPAAAGADPDDRASARACKPKLREMGVTSSGERSKRVAELGLAGVDESGVCPGQMHDPNGMVMASWVRVVGVGVGLRALSPTCAAPSTPLLVLGDPAVYFRTLECPVSSSLPGVTGPRSARSKLLRNPHPSIHQCFMAWAMPKAWRWIGVHTAPTSAVDL